MIKYMIIAVGGGIGAVLRFSMINGVHGWVGRGFPYGTMLVNVLGSLLIGTAYILLVQKASHQQSLLALLFMTGLLGGFTTYSAFTLDTIQLIQRGEIMASVIYIVMTTMCSLAACGVGVYITSMLIK